MHYLLTHPSMEVWQGGRNENPRITDPTHRLDNLLYEAIREGNPNLPIPSEIVKGFSNCGRGFYKQAVGLIDSNPRAEVERLFMKPNTAQPAGTVQPVSRWEEVE